MCGMKHDFTGRTFGRWHVIGLAYSKSPHHYYNCRCECGNERVVQGNSLRSGTTRSCGCLRLEVVKELHVKHRLCGHPAYQSWLAMRKRCESSVPKVFASYGGRGISVCERWNTFPAFWEDMGSTWAPGLSVDRIDNDGNYEPGNCRWATPAEQSRNRRSTILLDTPWGRLCQKDAAEKARISIDTLKRRMRSWPEEQWFLPPSR